MEISTQREKLIVVLKTAYPTYPHQTNETESRNSLVKDTNETNQSDDSSHILNPTSSRKLKLALEPYKNQPLNQECNNYNMFVKFGVLKSVIEKIGTYLDCLSPLRTELLPGEHQGFANNLIILCVQCTWRHDFYSLSIVISSKANDLRCKNTIQYKCENSLHKNEVFH